MRLVVLVSYAVIGIGCSGFVIQSDNSQSQVPDKNVRFAGTGIEPVNAGDQSWPVDFRNFTYPKDCLGEASDKSRSFALRNGHFNGGKDDLSFTFGSVHFADVTKDGQSEALVVLNVITGGSALPHCIYVFEKKIDKVQLIYDQYTGDRASGGLRRVHGDNGDLVIEQYTDDDGAGAARPNFFIRRRLAYANGKFTIKSEERLPNPDESAVIYSD